VDLSQVLDEGERIITFCYLCSQGIALLRRGWGHSTCGYQLSFTDRVHNFSAGDRTARRPQRLKPKHKTRESFHGAVVLFHDGIQIFGMADTNGGLVRLVVVRNRGGVRPTFIDRDVLREPAGANGRAQKRLGRVPIARGSEEEVNRVTLFIDSAGYFFS
jgi:hypothetical protein